MEKATNSFSPSTRRLYASFTLANFADGIWVSLLPLLALAWGASPQEVGVLTAINSLPWLLMSLVAGVWSDRYDRRKICRFANVVRTCLMGFLIVSGQNLPFLVMAVTLFTLGSAEVFFDTAALGFTKEVATEEEIPRLVSRLETSEVILNSFLGKPLAAFLASFGLHLLALILCSLAYLSSAFGLRKEMSEPIPKSARLQPAESESFWESLRLGWDFMRSKRALLVLLLQIVMANLVLSYWLSGVPIFILHELKASALHLVFINVLVALGAVLGGLICERFMNEKHKTILFRCGVLCFVLALAISAMYAEALVFVVTSALIGLGSILWKTVQSVYMYELVPEQYLGRIRGIFRTCTWGIIPLGTFMAGYSIENQMFGRGLWVGCAAFALIFCAENLKKRPVNC
jgi:MFS family permease